MTRLFRSLILDVYDDAAALLREHHPPEEYEPFTKSAALAGTDFGESEFDANNFALILVDGDEGAPEVFRKFATVDRGNTWLSLVYLEKTGHQLPEEVRASAAAALVKAAGGYRLEVPETIREWSCLRGAVSPPVFDFRQVVDKESVMEKAASPEEEAANIQQDINYFQADFVRMHPLERRRAALDLFEKGAAAGIDVSVLHDTYAGHDYGRFIEANVRSRYRYVPDDNQADYELLLQKRAEITPDQFAEALTSLDTGLNLEHHWDRAFADPVATTIFGQQAEKVADPVIEGQGANIRRSALIRLAGDKAKVARYFDADVAEALHRAPIDTYPALPAPLQQVLVDIAQR
jgi:hypothetical protein